MLPPLQLPTSRARCNTQRALRDALNWRSSILFRSLFLSSSVSAIFFLCCEFMPRPLTQCLHHLLKGQFNISCDSRSSLLGLYTSPFAFAFLAALRRWAASLLLAIRVS